MVLNQFIYCGRPLDSHNENEFIPVPQYLKEVFLGTTLACVIGWRCYLPREHQRFVPKLGRVADTVGPPNMRLYHSNLAVFLAVEKNSNGG